ncbi:MAG: hypothetical protein JNJ71_09210 [Rubrivivax sp.]|nr:hypothetical protein [Rubrivivax sp.]
MNSVSAREQQAVHLVDIIDFKWLMSHEGHHVHVERIQSDRAYAHDCLSKASHSSVEALREAACRLARKLSI